MAFDSSSQSHSQHIEETRGTTDFEVPAQHDASPYSRDRYGSGPAADGSRSHGSQGRKSNTAVRGGKHAAPATSSQRSRRLTADEVYPEITRVRRRNRKLKRIGAVIGCLLLALVVAGGAYAAWFIASLDSALAPEGDSGELKELLTPQVPDQPFYILIMGSDSREGNMADHVLEAGSNERSDVIMLVRIDTRKKLVTLLSIPRDTAYRLEDGSYVKINEMFNYSGAAGEVKAVRDTTGASIAHHAEVRISGLESIVDLLGGVTVDVPTELTYKTTDRETVTIEEGRQKLNGKEAQIFARARHEYETDQDMHRQDNVRQLITAIMDEILAKPVTELPGLILQLAEFIDTDMTTADAIGLAMAFSGGGMEVYNGTGPTNGDVNPQAGNKWLCYPNPEGWQAIMEVVDAGKNPKKAEIDYAATEILWSQVEGQPEFLDSLAYHYYYGG